MAAAAARTAALCRDTICLDSAAMLTSGPRAGAVMIQMIRTL